MKYFKLDPEEKELLKALEEDGFVSTTDEAEKVDQAIRSARANSVKDKTVNLRIPQGTIWKYKELSVKTHIPYQTLMGSAIHEYVTKQLAA